MTGHRLEGYQIKTLISHCSASDAFKLLPIKQVRSAYGNCAAPPADAWSLAKCPKATSSSSLCHVCDWLFERCFVARGLIMPDGFQRLRLRLSTVFCYGEYGAQTILMLRLSTAFLYGSLALQEADHRLEPASTRDGFAPCASFWHSCSSPTFPARRPHVDR